MGWEGIEIGGLERDPVEGEDVALTCTAFGVRLLSYFDWYFIDENVTVDNGIQIATERKSQPSKQNRCGRVLS